MCRLLRSYDKVPFADQEADLRRMLGTLPIGRLSIDQTGIGMHLAENLGRDFGQVVPETFTNESKEIWATDFKILLAAQGRRVAEGPTARRSDPLHQEAPDADRQTVVRGRAR